MIRASLSRPPRSPCMSGRTFFQFTLSGFLAVVFTVPSLAQFDPTVSSPLPIDPELLPMPRVKGSSPGRAVGCSNPSIFQPTVPPPPLCAFDVQLNPIQFTTPAFQMGGSVNSDMGMSGCIILNERNFDQCMGPSNAMPNTLAELIARLAHENQNVYHLYRVIAPPNARNTNQRGQIPVLGLTTIRFDESGGGWWVETVRLPQPRKGPGLDGPNVECLPAFNCQS